MMSRAFFRVVGCVVLVALAALAIAQSRLLLKQSHIMLGDQALFLGLPFHTGVEGTVQTMGWSRSGRYPVVSTYTIPDIKENREFFVYRTRPKDLETKIWVYDSTSKRTRMIANLGSTSVSDVQWSASESVLFVLAGEDGLGDEEPNYKFHALSVNGTAHHEAAIHDIPRLIDYHDREDRCLVACHVLATAAKPASVRYYSVGPTAEPQLLNEVPNEPIFVVGWRPGSNSIFGFRNIRNAGQVIHQSYELAPGATKWVPCDRQLSFYDQFVESMSLTIESGDKVYEDLSSGSPNLLKLILTDKQYRSTNDAYNGPWIPVGVGYDQYSIAEGNQRLAFASVGGVTVREIVALPKSRVEALMVTDPKEEIISQAKQVMIAILMFAAAHDDELPDPATFQSDILPYVQDQAMIDKFVYSYRGTRNSEKIEDPAQTEIGYIPAKGGRAVAYADGHVKWIADKG